MSRVKEIKRALDAAAAAVEGLDADLAAGRLDPAGHEQQRAERERETGRLFMALRRAQREARERVEPPAPAPERRLAALRSPVVMVPAALLLVVVGVGAGLTVGRWFEPDPGPGAPAGTRSTAPGAPAGLTSEIELGALRQAAARPDAPIASLLQLAHLALDQNRLDEARGLYDRVLAREPRNAEAITHLGGVLFQEGRVDEALARVEEALRIDPRYIHAHWDRTQYLYYGKRDFAATIRAAEAFLELVPQGPDADNVRKLMAEARQQGGGGAAPASRER